MSEQKPSKDVFIVFTNSEDGSDDEFNRWYDENHIHEILGVDGFLSAQRYELSPYQRPGVEPPEWRYLAIYEIEGDVPGIHAAVEAAGSRFAEPTGLKDLKVWVFTPRGDRVEAKRA